MQLDAEPEQSPSEEKKRASTSTAVSLVSPRAKSPVAAVAGSSTLSQPSTSVQSSLSSVDAKQAESAAPAPAKAPATPSKRVREDCDKSQHSSPKKRRSSSMPPSPQRAPVVLQPTASALEAEAKAARSPVRAVRSKSLPPPSPLDLTFDEIINAWSHLPEPQRKNKEKLAEALLEREVKLMNLEESARADGLTLPKALLDEVRKVEKNLMQLHDAAEADPQCRLNVLLSRRGKDRDEERIARARARVAASSAVGATSVSASSLASVVPAVSSDVSSSAAPASK